jgi:hypothetical protein
LDRSLKIETSLCDLKDMNRLITLERLANAGHFQNNRQMTAILCYDCNPRLLLVIHSMTHLEKLILWECVNLTLTEDVLQLFRSCPKITELRISLFDPKRVECQRLNEMNEDAKNELRSGFQRLVELDWTVYSCPVFQEIFT